MAFTPDYGLSLQRLQVCSLLDCAHSTMYTLAASGLKQGGLPDLALQKGFLSLPVEYW
jgi:hypothetical protein